MKQHEKKPSQKEVTPPQKEVCEKIEHNSTLDEAVIGNLIDKHEIEEEYLTHANIRSYPTHINICYFFLLQQLNQASLP